jgi:hypothetical protein
MFIAALFTTVKLCKQTRGPLLMNGLRKCVIYIQWNSIQPQRKNEILSFTGKWMELESIIISEDSQVGNINSHMFKI